MAQRLAGGSSGLSAIAMATAGGFVLPQSSLANRKDSLV
jgi:hypothetical protein